MRQSTIETSPGILVDLTEEEQIQVLLVDDESSSLKVAKQCLEMEGNFQVDTASSVEEAMKKLEKKTYDAVVSDHQMPGKDGLEFLKELRDKGNAVPFIVFTGKGREEVAIKALNLGADQYLNKAGDPETVYGELAHSIRNAVERSRAEERLRESEEKFRSMFENANDAMIHLDGSGRILEVNRKAEEVFGGSKKEVLGKHFTKIGIFSIKDIPRLMRGFANGFTGKKVTLNLRIKNQRGQEILLECSASPIRLGKKAVGRLVVARDVTERKKTEEAEERIRASEERYRSLVELTPDSIVTFDLKGVITSCNTASTKMTGYSKDEIVGKHFSKLRFLRARDIPKHLKLLSSAARGKVPESLEINCIRKDGTPYLVEVCFSLLKEGGKTIGFQVIGRDITERKRAEERLREGEEKFRNLAEQSPSMIFINKNGKIVYANEKCEEIMGYKRDEFYSPDFNFFTLIAPESRDRIKASFSRHTQGKEVAPYEYTIVTKEGRTMNAILTTKLIRYEGKQAILGTVTDVTEYKRAEKALKDTLKKLEMLNEKLSVVGGFTRHDVRNKLFEVTGNVYLARNITEDPRIRARLNDIESACREAVRMFDFARTYEMLGVEELVYMDVEESFEGAVSLFTGLRGVRVTDDCQVLVLADSLLVQLFYNLVDNSLKHGGNISQIRLCCKKAGKDHLKLVYEDDGVGIPEAKKELIFKEGYGKGTGHGLYLIKKICEVYGWTIQETGKQGKGARFTMLIPKMSEDGKMNYRLD